MLFGVRFGKLEDPLDIVLIICTCEEGIMRLVKVLEEGLSLGT